MSREVDDRIVSMQFDNGQFERNVSTTMSTLDKLKQSLNFKGASKGLENINAASGRVNMSGLGNAVESVRMRFSALEVMGVTALSNITNSAVNAGKRIISALTIDPVKTGFQEYETQINAIQTILANTQSEGTTIDQVNAALDELNKYADLTIYNFTEMTRNIGTFTAAGVKLKTSVSAIQGIANLAAVSGSTSQQAATAMYQLSQALSSGTVRLMDWNSVVNAGMGGQVFQNALRETSTLLKTGAEKAIKAQGSFRESLKTGWLTAEVLTETLKKFTTSGANEYVAKYTGLSKEAVEAALQSAKAQYGEADAIEYASKALAKKSGKNAQEIKDTLLFAKTAEDAATKVKTFTQLWDVLKEAAQSGWSQTWRLILGDFEEAKAIFTPLANFLTGIIGSISDARNKMLEKALGSPFGKLVEKINKTNDSIKSAVKTVKDYNDVVNQIISGKWGNGKTRWDKLTKAGYDWAHAQNLVNEKVGVSLRRNTQYKESQEELSKTQNRTIAQLAEMSDAQLKSAGYTQEQVDALRELKSQAEKTGIPLEEFIKNIDKLDGRTLLINSLKNAGQGLVKVFTSISTAWREAFYGDASEEDVLNKKASQIYNLIAGLHKLSLNLQMSDETADKLRRTFKGLFSVLDIVKTIAGGTIGVAFKFVSKVLENLDLNILDVTASIGDMLVQFRDWVFKNNLIAKGIDKVAGVAAKGVKKIAEWAKAFVQLPAVQNTIEKFKEAFTFDNVVNTIKSMIDTVKKWIEAFSELPIISDVIGGLKNSVGGASEIGKNIIDGLVAGLNDGTKTLWDVALDLGRNILQSIKDFLGIHSPSTEMHEVGTNVIQGLVNGLKEGISKIGKVLIRIASNIKETLGGIPWGNLFAAGLSVAMVFVVKQIADGISGIGSAFEGLGDLFERTGKVMNSFSKVLNGISWDFKAKALQKIAIALGILVVAIIALASIDDIGKLWNAVGVIAALSGILIGLAFAMDKMSSASVKMDKSGLSLGGLKSGLIQIGLALLLLAATVKVIGSMDMNQAIQGFAGLTVLMLEMVGFLAVIGVIAKGGGLDNVKQIGSLMLRLSVALLLMVGVVKLVNMLSPEEMLKGAAFAVGFGIFVTALSKAAKGSNKYVSKLGGMMIKIALAMALMVGVVKTINMLSAEEMLKGAAFAAGFGLFVTALVRVTKMGTNQQIAKVGGMMMAMSTSMLIMAGVIKLISSMSWGDLTKGAIGITVFSGIMLGLVALVKRMGPNAPKIATTLVAMSVAIGIIAAVAMVLSFIDTAGLAKGVIAVSLLGGVAAAMILATKGANNVKGNLIVMSIAIGVMAAAVATLSLIDSRKLAGATASLSILMGMFALISKSSGGIGKSTGSIFVMVGVVGALAGVIYLLSSLEFGKTLEISASLSLLLMSLSACMLLISKTGTMAMKAVAPMAVLTLLLGGVALILGLLAKSNPGSTLEIATSLSMLLLSLSASLGILTLVGLGGPAALIGVASLAALIVAVGGLMVAIGALATEFPQMEDFLNKGLPLLEKIGYGIGSFFGNIVGGFSAGATSGLPEIGKNLSSFMTNLSGFIEGAKTIDGSALSGVGNLVLMMAAISGGVILDSIAEWVTGKSSMETFKTNILVFADAVIALSDKLKGANIDEAAITSVANAGRLFSGLQNSLPKTGGLWQKVAGVQDLTKFGEALVEFGPSIKRYAESVKGLDSSSVETSANAAKALAEMASYIPNEGGVVGWFAGENSIARFGDELVALGVGLKGFSVATSGINTESIVGASSAAKSLTEMTRNIPNSGGVASWFAGENSIAQFSKELILLGNGLKGFSISIGGIVPENITAASNAAKNLAEMTRNIPNSGGVASWFAGENSISKFGNELILLGYGLKGFSTAITGVNTGNITSASSAAKSLAEMTTFIPSEGGIKAWFSGESGVAKFSENLPKLGEAIKGFSNSLEGVSPSNITAAANAGKSLAEMTNTAPNDSGNMVFFGNNLTKFGELLRKYFEYTAEITPASIYSSNVAFNAVKSIESVDSAKVSSASAAINDMANAIKNMSAIPNNSADGFMQSLSRLGQTDVKAFVQAFESGSTQAASAINKLLDSMLTVAKSKYSDFQLQGSTLVDKIRFGVDSFKSIVNTAFKTMLNSVTTTIRGYYYDFNTAASYLVTGFANGISANTYKATAQARAMAKAAADAAKKALDEHSPSKVFYKIGDFAGLGFVNALKDYVSIAYKSGTNIAESAKNGIGRAIDKVSDLIGGGINAQPTIRPVLDLSNIESGAGRINSMFSIRPSVGVLANVGAINTRMNRQSQNGGNSDVVSAINKLRSDLGNVGNTYNTIDGVTYDDGSAISNAVKSIIRATKVERRI